jgi:L,D-transpeptidase YcbB
MIRPAIAMLMALLVCAPLVRVPPVQAAPSEDLQSRIGALAEDARVAGRPVADRWLLARIYERREFTPAWDDWAKFEQLLSAVAASARHGLHPEDYHHDMLLHMADARRSGSLGPGLELELLATDALARLALHLRFGKVNPEQLEPTWNFSRASGTVSPVTAIHSLLQADDLAAALAALAPDGDYYSALIEGLAAYRLISARGGWARVPGGETLRAGMQSTRVPALRARLAATGDWPAEESVHEAELFDEALESAVRHFQARHGLEVDGAVGRKTLAAMNVPVEARIDQIRANLERVRWVFHDLEARFLLVNIARFRVVLVENRQVTWSTRAVVGQPYRQTPVFKARMTYLEFNPSWTVPPTILREDLLPELRGDPDALQRKNMVVLDHLGKQVDASGIDWANASWRTFPYMIRQEPGPGNALGRVKFMYPNPYHVYMHDTPTRALFARAERTFSSGCIRLENPFELVRILLAGTEWDDAAIEQVLASNRTRVVNLPEPIPVLTLYGTVVPENGRMHFAADVYGRDARLLAALDAPYAFSQPAGFGDATLP